ncbi:MAG: lmo0937 family membrane protein [Gemmatimonadales bacterium]
MANLGHRAVLRPTRSHGVPMYMLAVLLVVGWLLGVVVFKIAGMLIHVLLIVALGVIILKMMRGRRPVP